MSFVVAVGPQESRVTRRVQPDSDHRVVADPLPCVPVALEPGEDGSLRLARSRLRVTARSARSAPARESSPTSSSARTQQRRRAETDDESLRHAAERQPEDHRSAGGQDRSDRPERRIPAAIRATEPLHDCLAKPRGRVDGDHQRGNEGRRRQPGEVVHVWRESGHPPPGDGPTRDDVAIEVLDDGAGRRDGRRGDPRGDRDLDVAPRSPGGRAEPEPDERQVPEPRTTETDSPRRSASNDEIRPPTAKIATPMVIVRGIS